MGQLIKKQQNIIWREWRNCGDEEYAKRLFDLVADELASWASAIAIVLVGVVYGTIAGLFARLTATNWEMRNAPEYWLMGPAVLPFVWNGIGIGGVTGLVVWFCAGRRLTWRACLQGLVSDEGGLHNLIVALPLSGLVGGAFAGSALGIVGGVMSVMLGGVMVGVLGILLGVGFVDMLSSRPKPYCYECRSWCFWWWGRPRTFELEKALRTATQKEWVEVLSRLETRKQQSGSSTSLITALQSSDWNERFIARHHLAASSGEAVEKLLEISQDKRSNHRHTARWLIKNIAEETTKELKSRAKHLFCPRHLIRFHANKASVSRWKTFTYYGCRQCGQSREFFEWRGKVVAVLDEGMVEEQTQIDDSLRVNWLKRNGLFDFDRVEITQATDEQVERFILQVRNDTDEYRRPGYKKMQCVVAPECHLSENTMRILRDTFDKVSAQ